MIGRCALLILAISSASGLPSLAQDHLEPEEGFLSADDLTADYARKVRDVLLKDARYDYPASVRLRMVCLPSFEPEWAVSVVRVLGPRRGDPILYFVDYVVVDKQLWPPGNKASQTAKVKTFRVPIDDDTAGEIEAIGSRMLRSVRYPADPVNANDGENYHFSGVLPPVDGDPGAFHAGVEYPAQGQTGSSPDENSSCGKLVAIGVDLKAYALTQSTKDGTKVRAIINEKIKRLGKRLDRADRKP